MHVLLNNAQNRFQSEFNYEIESRYDEDINTIVTPTAPAAIHTGPITRARARMEMMACARGTRTELQVMISGL